MYQWVIRYKKDGKWYCWKKVFASKIPECISQIEKMFPDVENVSLAKVRI